MKVSKLFLLMTALLLVGSASPDSMLLEQEPQEVALTLPSFGKKKTETTTQSTATKKTSSIGSLFKRKPKTTTGPTTRTTTKSTTGVGKTFPGARTARTSAKTPSRLSNVKTGIGGIFTSGAAKIKEQIDKGIATVKAFVEKLPGAIKKTIDEIDYDERYINFAIEIPDTKKPQVDAEGYEVEDATLQKQRPKIGITIDTGFGGAGLGPEDPVIDRGFPKGTVDFVPSKLFGFLPIKSLLFGAKKDTPKATKKDEKKKRPGIVGKILEVLPEEMGDDLQELIDVLLEAPGDTIFVLKVFALLNTARTQYGADVVSGGKYILTQLPFLMARLAYTIDQEATMRRGIVDKKKTAMARKRDPKAPPVYRPVYFEPSSPIRRVVRILKLQSLLESLEKSITVPIGQFEFDEYQLRLLKMEPGKSIPPTNLERAIADVRNTRIVQGYMNRTQETINKIVPLITKELDSIDRRLLVRALHTHAKEVIIGVDAEDIEDLTEKEIEAERKAVLEVRVNGIKPVQQKQRRRGKATADKGTPGLIDLLTQAQAAMERAGFEAGYLEQIKLDIEWASNKDVLKLYEPVSEVPISEEKVQVSLLELMDMKYKQFVEKVARAKFEGHPDYVDLNFPLSEKESLERLLAVGFRVIRELPRARKAFLQTEEGKAAFAQAIGGLQEQKAQAKQAARDAMTNYKKVRSQANKDAFLAAKEEMKRVNKEYNKAVFSLNKLVVSHVFDIVPVKTLVVDGVEQQVGGWTDSIKGVTITEFVRIMRRTESGLVQELKNLLNVFMEPIGMNLDDLVPQEEVDFMEEDLELEENDMLFDPDIYGDEELGDDEYADSDDYGDEDYPDDEDSGEGGSVEEGSDEGEYYDDEAYEDYGEEYE